MNWDLLLTWMTHLGEGSWGQFRRTAAELAPDEEDLHRLCSTLRTILSDLGHADFFVGGSDRWEVPSPTLGGIPGRVGYYGLVGGRIPGLVQALRDGARSRGTAVEVKVRADRPTSVLVTGEAGQVEDLASSLGICFVPDLAEAAVERQTPVPELASRAKESPAPINWLVRSFNFEQMRWTEGLERGTAVEYLPRAGLGRYFLHRRRGRLRELPKREAVYAAAMIRGARLVDWTADGGRLAVPLAAPLPELLSRAACLSSGEAPIVEGGWLIYQRVPGRIAALVATAAGQSHLAMLGPERSGCRG